MQLFAESKIRKSFLRSGSLFILVTFISTQTTLPISSASAQNSNAPIRSEPASVSTLTGEISDGAVVPPELGTTDEVYATHNSPSDRTIILIQDAHDSLEAQENISKIIEHLVANYGVQTVFEEGYEGPVPTDKYFGFIKDPEIKKKVSYFLMDHLRLGGAEYAHINRGSQKWIQQNKKSERGIHPAPREAAADWRLIGADSLKLHRENINQYRLSTEKKEVITKDLNALGLEIRSLADKRFPNEFKEWIKIKEQFDAKKLDLFTYLGRSIPLHEPRKSDSQAQTGLLHLLLEATKSNDPLILEKIKRIDTREVFDEIAKLEQRVVNTFLTDQTDRRLFTHYQTLCILRRLNNLQVTQEEYAYLTTSDLFDTQSLAEFIHAQTGKPVVLSKHWEQNIKEAVKFYEIAQLRDNSLAEALDKYFSADSDGRTTHRDVKQELKRSHQKAHNEHGGLNAKRSILDNDTRISILVYGGFHKENIKRILKSKGINYLIVSPQITKLSLRHEQFYKQLMTAGRLSYESPLPETLQTATRAESSFEVWNETGKPALAQDELKMIALVFEGNPEKHLDYPSRSLAAENVLRINGFHSARSEMRDKYSDLDKELQDKISAVGLEKYVQMMYRKDSWKGYRFAQYFVKQADTKKLIELIQWAESNEFLGHSLFWEILEKEWEEDGLGKGFTEYLTLAKNDRFSPPRHQIFTSFVDDFYDTDFLELRKFLTAMEWSPARFQVLVRQFPVRAIYFIRDYHALQEELPKLITALIASPAFGKTRVHKLFSENPLTFFTTLRSLNSYDQSFEDFLKISEELQRESPALQRTFIAAWFEDHGTNLEWQNIIVRNDKRNWLYNNLGYLVKTPLTEWRQRLPVSDILRKKLFLFFDPEETDHEAVVREIAQRTSAYLSKQSYLKRAQRLLESDKKYFEKKRILLVKQVVSVLFQMRQNFPSNFARYFPKILLRALTATRFVDSYVIDSANADFEFNQDYIQKLTQQGLELAIAHEAGHGIIHEILYAGLDQYDFLEDIRALHEFGAYLSELAYSQTRHGQKGVQDAIKTIQSAVFSHLSKQEGFHARAGRKWLEFIEQFPSSDWNQLLSLFITRLQEEKNPKTLRFDFFTETLLTEFKSGYRPPSASRPSANIVELAIKITELKNSIPRTGTNKLEFIRAQLPKSQVMVKNLEQAYRQIGNFSNNISLQGRVADHIELNRLSKDLLKILIELRDAAWTASPHSTEWTDFEAIIDSLLQFTEEVVQGSGHFVYAPPPAQEVEKTRPLRRHSDSTEGTSKRSETRINHERVSSLKLLRPAVLIVEKWQLEMLPKIEKQKLAAFATINRNKFQLVVPDLLEGAGSSFLDDLKTLGVRVSHKLSGNVGASVVVAVSNKDQDSVSDFKNRMDRSTSGTSKKITDYFALENGKGIYLALLVKPENLPFVRGFRHDQSGLYSTAIDTLLQDLSGYVAILSAA